MIKDMFYKLMYLNKLECTAFVEEAKKDALKESYFLIMEFLNANDITLYHLSDLENKQGKKVHGRYISVDSDELKAQSKKIQHYLDTQEEWEEYRQQVFPRIELDNIDAHIPLWEQGHQKVITLCHEAGHGMSDIKGLKLNYEDEEQFADDFLLEIVKKLPDIKLQFSMRLITASFTNRLYLVDIENYMRFLGISWEGIHKDQKEKKRENRRNRKNNKLRSTKRGNGSR